MVFKRTYKKTKKNFFLWKHKVFLLEINIKMILFSSSYTLLDPLIRLLILLLLLPLSFPFTFSFLEQKKIRINLIKLFLSETSYISFLKHKSTKDIKWINKVITFLNYWKKLWHSWYLHCNPETKVAMLDCNPKGMQSN